MMLMQEIAVFVIVGLAFANLVRIWGGASKSSSGCGKCSSGGGCGTKSESKPAPQLVQLQMNLKHKE